jgi:uncharacterized protein YfcZ (UPF0381/DUF406 family)
MDIGTIGTLLSSVKTASEIAKLIKDSGLSLEKAEAKMKLAELISSLADVKSEAAEIQQSILDKDARIRELEGEAKVRNELKWREPCYFLPNSEGIEEPFCQHCYDSSKNLSRLHSDNKGRYVCRVCDKSFSTHERVAADNAAFLNNKRKFSTGVINREW